MAERDGEPGSESGTLRLLRRLLLAVVVFGIVGLAGELILLEHWESPLQWTPFLVMLLSLPIILRTAFRPTRTSVLALRIVMACFVVAGAAGLWLHWRSNALLELEMNPSLEGREYFLRTLFGGTPFLAPGALMQLGLMGLLATFRHPAAGPGQDAQDVRPPLGSSPRWPRTE